MSTSTPSAQKVRLQAAEWLLELQSEPVSEEVHQRWQAWRQAHPDHELAWKRVEAFSARLGKLPAPLARAALASSASPRRRQAVKALAVLVFAGGTAHLAWDQRGLSYWVADRRTGVGERVAVSLPDGSSVQLNTSTAIDVQFTDERRILRLLGGEILVATARDPQGSRPFIVQTAQGRIQALGTRFSVRDTSDRANGACHVAVFEGAVALRPGRSNDTLLRLDAGEQGHFDRDTATATGNAQGDDLAWTQGMLVAQDMPLANFLAELGRHRPGHLVCSADVAHLPVTGTYPLADTDRVLDLLASTLPLRVQRLTRYWVRVVAA